MKTVLHITPHMGGGVGKVMTALIDEFRAVGSQPEHLIVSFEAINERCRRWAKKNGVEYFDEISPVSPTFHRWVREADIVQLHFWNHSAIFRFMQVFSGQRARTVIWSHVNGHHEPYKFSRALLRFPELFVVSTPYSLSAPDVQALPIGYFTDHIRCVFSTAGTKGFRDVRPVPHEGFRIGYVGTVNYRKLHSSFIGLCSRINIPDVKFVVCGGEDHREIQQLVTDFGLDHLFDFRGVVDNVPQVLAELDVFGYPLNPEHYGTGEQALQEAMAAGVPQVVLANGPEMCVVKDGVTGIVAPTVQGYVKAIETLYHGRLIRERFSDCSRDYAERHYSIEKAAREWIEVYDELLERDKQPCVFEGGI